MINEWIEALTDLLLLAPGNSVPATGPVWPSTLERLGELDADVARERVYRDYFEAQTNVADHRPFFVLREHVNKWTAYSATFDLSPTMQFELAYTEDTLLGAASHKEAVQHFSAFTDELIRWMADNARNSAGFPIRAIDQVVFPQRTARANRDPRNPKTDYFWAAWLIHAGQLL